MTSSHPTQVRVETTPDALQEQEKKDYASLLNENLELMRRVTDLSTASQVLVTKRAEAERALAEERAKNKKRGGYQLGRRLVFALHVLLSITTMLSGALLWFFRLAPVEIWWLTVAGFVWLGTTTYFIYDLADRERDY